MCYEIQVEAKAEPAVGFPDGWRFYFAKALKATWSERYKVIPSLWIISPGGKRYRSAEAAVGGHRLADGSKTVREFYDHVGLSCAGHSCQSISQQDSNQQAKKSQLSLSKYRVVGSRVYCRVQKQEFWGTIEEKFQLEAKSFQYSVRTETRS